MILKGLVNHKLYLMLYKFNVMLKYYINDINNLIKYFVILIKIFLIYIVNDNILRLGLQLELKLIFAISNKRYN